MPARALLIFSGHRGHMTIPSRTIDPRYLALGIAVGAALGVALHHLGRWIAIGVVLGSILGRRRGGPG